MAVKQGAEAVVFGGAKPILRVQEQASEERSSSAG